MSKTLSEKAKSFLTSHELAVLSTVSRAGHVQGVAVYYYLMDSHIYVVTKSDSYKAHNMLANPHIAFTVYDADEIKTLQLQGDAHIEADPETKNFIFEKLVRQRDYGGEKRLPPVTDLHAGSFIIFRIEPTDVNYTDYKDGA